VEWNGIWNRMKIWQCFPKLKEFSATNWLWLIIFIKVNRRDYLFLKYVTVYFPYCEGQLICQSLCQCPLEDMPNLIPQTWSLCCAKIGNQSLNWAIELCLIAIMTVRQSLTTVNWSVAILFSHRTHDRSSKQK